MTVLRDDIAAFDRMRSELEEKHPNSWVVFHQGRFIDAFADFESAAESAVEQFANSPYLIRQLGVSTIQLPGGMIFTPAHVLGAGGL